MRDERERERGTAKGSQSQKRRSRNQGRRCNRIITLTASELEDWDERPKNSTNTTHTHTHTHPYIHIHDIYIQSRLGWSYPFWEWSSRHLRDHHQRLGSRLSHQHHHPSNQKSVRSELEQKSSDWSLKKTCRLIKLSKEMTNQHPKHNSINPTSFNPEDIRFHWPFHHPQGLDGGRTSNQTDSSDFKSMSYRSYSSLLNQTNSNSPFSISPTNPLPCSSIDLSSPVARRSSVTVQYLNFNLLGFFDLLSTLRTV